MERVHYNENKLSRYTCLFIRVGYHHYRLHHSFLLVYLYCQSHTQTKEMKRCEKCNTNQNITRHHILPQIFWRGSGGISYLCEYCHREIEGIIRIREIQVSGNKHKRCQLDKKEYQGILIDFLNGDLRLHNPIPA